MNTQEASFGSRSSLALFMAGAHTFFLVGVLAIIAWHGFQWLDLGYIFIVATTWLSALVDAKRYVRVSA